MNTAVSKPEPAFAVWITGLPSSGKSTLAAALAKELLALGQDVAVLESDELRKLFTPHPVYSEQERDTFYGAMVYVGKLLVDHGVPVIFDATANRRLYRNRARNQITKFFEVYANCPLAVCMERDAKGIYRKAQEGGTSTAPGLQVPYEPPESPEMIISDQDSPEVAARKLVSALETLHYLNT